jgi:hypothetical protein
VQLVQGAVSISLKMTEVGLSVTVACLSKVFDMNRQVQTSRKDSECYKLEGESTSTFPHYVEVVQTVLIADLHRSSFVAPELLRSLGKGSAETP